MLKKFMFMDGAPTEIHLVQIRTDEDRRAKIDAAIAAARESMGKKLLVHPDNRVQRLKAA
jgi:hypothetical protein